MVSHVRCFLSYSTSKSDHKESKTRLYAFLEPTRICSIKLTNDSKKDIEHAKPSVSKILDEKEYDKNL